MRQIQTLLKVCGKGSKIDFYVRLLSYAKVHDKEIPSLDEFLNLSSNNTDGERKAFDEETDKRLEAHALKMLNERQSIRG